jgi:hypothetical protein
MWPPKAYRIADSTLFWKSDSPLESGTDGESNSRDKRIPKANAVDVFGAREDHEFPAGFVSS